MYQDITSNVTINIDKIYLLIFQMYNTTVIMKLFKKQVTNEPFTILYNNINFYKKFRK